MDSLSVRLARVAEPRAESLAYAGLTLASLGWASAFIAGKVVLVELTPLPAATWRYSVAALVLLPFALRQRPTAVVKPPLWPLAVMVISGGVLYPWLFLLALAHTSATNTALLIALNPVFTVLLAPLVGERLSGHRLVGVSLALAGAATVITSGDWRRMIGVSFNAGDLLAVLAAVVWSGFNLACRGVVARFTPAFTNCVIYAVGAPLLYILAWGERPWTQLSAASPLALTGILAMAILSSVLAGQLFLMGVRQLGVSRTVVFIYLVPVVTAVLSTTLLGEPLEVAQAIGGAAVLAGVYWSTRTRADLRLKEA